MKQLGEILVEAGIISRKTLERALERQKESRARLGSILEEMGVITEEELAEALGTQFNFKTVKNFISHRFSPELLELLPVDFVMSRLVFPLKQKDNMLAVAINNPFDMEAMEMITRMTGYQVIPVIAGRREIQDAIARFYLQRTTGDGQGDVILIVEDTLVVAAVIRDILTREGYTVLLAADGVDGLKLAVSERPRLIITDSVMPRMDGFELLRAVRTNPMTDDIPMIMLTSRSAPEDEQKALDSGFFDFVSKPVEPERIVSRVRRALEMTRRARR